MIVARILILLTLTIATAFNIHLSYLIHPQCIIKPIASKQFSHESKYSFACMNINNSNHTLQFNFLSLNGTSLNLNKFIPYEGVNKSNDVGLVDWKMGYNDEPFVVVPSLSIVQYFQIKVNQTLHWNLSVRAITIDTIANPAGIFIAIGSKIQDQDKYIIQQYSNDGKPINSILQIPKLQQLLTVKYIYNRSYICYSTKQKQNIIWHVRCISSRSNVQVYSRQFDYQIIIEPSLKRFKVLIVSKNTNRGIIFVDFKSNVEEIRKQIQFLDEEDQLLAVRSCTAEKPIEYLVLMSRNQNKYNGSKISLVSIRNNQITLEDHKYFLNDGFVNGFQCINGYIIGTSKSYTVTALIQDDIEWLILIPIFVPVLIIILSIFIFRRIKFVIIKNMKTYFRTWKFFYYILALLISFGNLKILFVLIQQLQGEAYIKYYPQFFFMQYFFIVFVITLYECYEQSREQNYYLKLHRAQGISIFNYFITKIYYIFLMIILLGVINTLCLLVFGHFTIQNAVDYLIIMTGFITCTLSNISFCLVLTTIIKKYSILFSGLAIHHILSTIMIQTIRIADKDNQIYVQLYQGYNGILCYFSILSNRLSPYTQNQISQSDLSTGLIESVVQTVVYLTLYMLILYFKNRKSIYFSFKNQFNDEETLLSSEQSYKQRCIVQISNGGKKLGGKSIFDNVEFSINKSQLFVILGANESGKTTLINSLLRMVKLSEGEVYLNNAVKVGCCLQQNIYYEQLTFIEHIQYLAQIRNISLDDIPRLVEDMVNIFYFENQKDKRAKELSGGNLKKLCLACAFVGNVNLLVFDEPSLGLDVNFKKIFWKLLKQKKDEGLTIIVVTSDNQQAQILADRVYLMQQNLTVSDLSQNRKYELRISLKTDSQGTQVSKKLKDDRSCIISPQNINYNKYRNELSLIMSLRKQDLLQSVTVQQILSTKTDQIKHISFNSISNIIAKQQIMNVIKTQNGKHSTYDVLTTQLKSVILKRLIIYRYYFLLNMFVFFSQIIIGLLAKILSKQNQVTHILAIILSLFVYFQPSIIRSDQMQKNRYKNAIIFGINRSIYWFGFLLIDIIIGIILYSVSYGIIVGIVNLANINGITFADSFVQEIYAVWIFICLFTVISYIFSSLFRTHLLYVCWFFFLNGFCFFLVENSQFSLIQVLNITQVYYYPQTLYSHITQISKGSSKQLKVYDYFLLYCMIFQLFLWIVSLILFLYFRERLEVKQTGVKSKQIGFQISNDLKQQQFDIQNIDNVEQIPVLADYIYKTFGKKHYQLKNVSIMIKKGEVYGLLGANGSGKSTFFSIVTGLQAANSGTITYYGHKLWDLTDKQHRHVGYCPQFDYLDDIFTVKQSIAYYGAMKGLSKGEIDSFASKYLQYFELTQQIDKRVQDISGGDRRKLCSILTFIGNPKILFFDEPSAGMDSVSRVKLWKLIQIYCKEKKASVLLTTHNIEQAQIYCDKIGVLKAGELIAIGSPEDLVAKYSKKYRLILKLKSMKNIQDIQGIIQKNNYFFNITFHEQTKKLIYDFAMIKVSPSEIIDRTINILIRNGMIEYFQFYQHNLQNVVAYLSSNVAFQSVNMED